MCWGTELPRELRCRLRRPIPATGGIISWQVTVSGEQVPLSPTLVWHILTGAQIKNSAQNKHTHTPSPTVAQTNNLVVEALTLIKKYIYVLLS